MKREQITEGQELVVQPDDYRRRGWDRVTVVSKGGLFIRVSATVNGGDRKGLFHPSELEPVPGPRVVLPVDVEAISPGPSQEVSDSAVAHKLDIVLAEERAARIADDTRIARTLDNIARKHKWNTPGRHLITSYRSFRRYKAAGAGFVVKTAGSDNLADGCFVAISVNKARQRAQDGLDIYAVVSA